MKKWSRALSAGFILCSLSVTGMAQSQAPPESGERLLDDAVRIIVLDESRCSASDASQAAGRSYVIEGKDKIQRLRREFRKIDTEQLGGCLCGGPDVQFYAETAAGDTRYFGLDCGRYLAGHPIPGDLAALLTPSKPAFLGKDIGATYVLDIPLEMEEADVRSAVRGSGLLVLVGGYWNMFTGSSPRVEVLYWHERSVAPVRIEFKIGPLKTSLPDLCDYFAIEKALEEEAIERVTSWLKLRGLYDHLLFDPTARESESSSEEATLVVECFLDSARLTREAIAKNAEPGEEAINVSEVDFRTGEQMAEKDYYQAALVVPDWHVKETIERLRRLLPGARKIEPICERKPDD